MAEWVFEEPIRVRQGGSAAQYAFSPKLDVFVREVVQNSKDQKDANATDPVRVDFRLLRLSGDALEAFRVAVDWQSLVEHLRAAGQRKNTHSIMRAVEELEEARSLLLLRVDDFGTGGLVGGDFDEDRPFSSLCVDELFSVKKSQGAGGSYGLGKSVLWRFSGLSTVLFSSRLSDYPDGASGLRIFGRAQLPWHKVGGDSFQGTCWFGERSERNGRLTAMSVWGPASDEIAERLCLDRKSDTGTSILLLGFTPPAAEDVSRDDALAGDLVSAATKHFWPVLLGDQPELRVTGSFQDLGTGDTTPEQSAGLVAGVEPFRRCLDDYRAGRTTEALDTPDDTATVNLPFKIPARMDGSAGPIDASVTLCVRLLSGRRLPLTDHVAEVRGFGMVVRYRDLKGLSLSARPFHAVLVCGTLRGTSEADRAVEDFLQLAEPPEHNKWVSTPRLRDTYKRGYNKALEELDRAVVNTLKRLVSQPVKGGEAGPDRLAMLFPIGQKGREEREHAFRVKSRSAFLRPDGRWLFAAEVERTQGAGDWSVRVQLRPATDDGADRHSIIGEATCDPSLPISVHAGAARLVVPASTRTVRISGVSDPGRLRVDGRRVAMRLDVAASASSQPGTEEA